MGNIGKTVLRRARAFGMHLLGNDIIDIAMGQPEFIRENEVEMTRLEDLLRRSDFVSLHCDLNPTSYHLINRQTLAWMKPSALPDQHRARTDRGRTGPGRGFAEWQPGWRRV